MKLREGNSYVCIKGFENGDNSKISIGAICRAVGDRLYGFDNDNVYGLIKPMDDYGEYFTLYEESPYNKEQKELRERYAGMAMNAIVSHPKTIQKIVDMLQDKGDEKASRLEEVVAKQAISFADALIKELRKEE